MKTFALVFAAFLAGSAVSTLTMPMPWWPAREGMIDGAKVSACWTADRVPIVVAGLMKLGFLRP